MITVRYPNGLAVRYARANHVKYSSGTNILSPVAWLYTKDDGQFIASVPKECAIEFEEGTPVSDTTDAAIIVERLTTEPHKLKWLSYGTLRRLKQALKQFDIRTGRWDT